MNQIIKELADQCGLYIAYDNRAVTDKELESFAELIIQECARIGELKEQDHEDYDSDISVGWYMRQHFGFQ